MDESESFEAVYRQLEEVVRRLDDGGLTLDASIALYEEGMTLAQRCRSLLDHAELRVTQLQDLLDRAEHEAGDGLDDDENDDEE
jgi:exodeoxyribonuclease VII small subunit